MNPALNLTRPAPHRVALILALMIVGMLANALSHAPSIARLALRHSPPNVCHCAHCPGGAKCCCQATNHCSMP